MKKAVVLQIIRWYAAQFVYEWIMFSKPSTWFYILSLFYSINFYVMRNFASISSEETVKTNNNFTRNKNNQIVDDRTFNQQKTHLI